jgi:hypothetical protein
MLRTATGATFPVFCSAASFHHPARVACLIIFFYLLFFSVLVSLRFSCKVLSFRLLCRSRRRRRGVRLRMASVECELRQRPAQAGARFARVGLQRASTAWRLRHAVNVPPRRRSRWRPRRPQRWRLRIGGRRRDSDAEGRHGGARPPGGLRWRRCALGGVRLERMRCRCRRALGGDGRSELRGSARRARKAEICRRKPAALAAVPPRAARKRLCAVAARERSCDMVEDSRAVHRHAQVAAPSSGTTRPPATRLAQRYFAHARRGGVRAPGRRHRCGRRRRVQRNGRGRRRGGRRRGGRRERNREPYAARDSRRRGKGRPPVRDQRSGKGWPCAWQCRLSPPVRDRRSGRRRGRPLEPPIGL